MISRRNFLSSLPLVGSIPLLRGNAAADARDPATWHSLPFPTQHQVLSDKPPTIDIFALSTSQLRTRELGGVCHHARGFLRCAPLRRHIPVFGVEVAYSQQLTQEAASVVDGCTATYRAGPTRGALRIELAQATEKQLNSLWDLTGDVELLGDVESAFRGVPHCYVCEQAVLVSVGGVTRRSSGKLVACDLAFDFAGLLLA